MDWGHRFRDAVAREIESWDCGITVKTEKLVGLRFVGIPRKLDIILKHNDRYLGIECKSQFTNGTADEKIFYTVDDTKASPIPSIIVFSGNEIKEDIKSKLIISGIGLELGFIADTENPLNDRIDDPKMLFRQRVYMELGLDWFELYDLDEHSKDKSNKDKKARETTGKKGKGSLQYQIDVPLPKKGKKIQVTEEVEGE